MEMIRLNLIPDGIQPVLHCKQYDKGRVVRLCVFNGTKPYIFTDETVELNIRKGDGTIYTTDLEVVSGKRYVDVVTAEQMCAVAGNNEAEIRILKDETNIGSANFILEVQKSPMQGGLQSESEINNLARQVHDDVVTELADYGAEDTGYNNAYSGLEATNVQEAIDEVNDKVDNIPSVDAYTKQESDAFITDEYDATSTYAVGDMVIHENALYVCSTAITTAEAWNSAHWTLTDIATAIGTVKTAIPTKTSDLQNDSGFAQIDDTSTADNKVWSAEKTANGIKEPLNLAEAVITNNDINPLNWVTGNYINHNNGELVRDNNYITTEYISVTPLKRYVSYKTNHFAWYNENKVFISGSNTVVNEVAPYNAKYIRVDFNKANKDEAFFRIGFIAPYYKNYGIDYPWLDNTNPINPERFERWGAYFANLFNKYTSINGYYVKHDTGEKATSATYFLSDYIKVKPDTTYVMSKGNRYAVYDSDYQYITGANLSGDNVEFTTPNNAVYLLVCNTPLTRKDTLVVAEKSVYTTAYESFGIAVPWLKPKVAKSKYDGKKLICFGDSITSMGYTDAIIADTGMEAVNVGLSSARYAYADDANVYVNAFAFHNIVDAIVSGDWTIPDSISGVSGYEIQYQHIQDMKAIDFSTVDFVSIAFGTNDFSSATPLDNPNDEFDTNYFKGAIRYCLKKLTEAYPNLKIIGVTPCYRFWVSGGEVLYDSDEHDISGMYLSDFIEAIEEVYADFHLPVVNNYDNAGINKYNRLQYFNITDGLHPKINGREILGHRIGSGILLNY